jgi:hypothetical protein
MAYFAALKIPVYKVVNSVGTVVPESSSGWVADAAGDNHSAPI